MDVLYGCSPMALANTHLTVSTRWEREFGGREGEQRSRQLCTSRLASGLHLYPHTSYRKEGEPRGPMRQYVPIIFHLVLFHSLAILSFPPSSSIVDYLVRHHVSSPFLASIFFIFRAHSNIYTSVRFEYVSFLLFFPFYSNFFFFYA